ncbi:integrin-linked kinase-associated serine/threonine phosphatase 2C-like [Amphiura filiformis]|uniref:integrin-linked kinase-associated serine/threonine phosphatase 2C-like n=1 Tax=Amphiura filiformis TaxID=82378 RepID=UPI003B2197C7
MSDTSHFDDMFGAAVAHAGIQESQETTAGEKKEGEKKSADDELSKIKDNAAIGVKRKAEEKPEDSKRKKLAPGLYEFHSYVAERKGEREDMQDTHVLIDDFTDQFHNLPTSVHRVAYYAVFDGHCGSKASQHAANVLHKKLISKFPRGEVSHFDKEMKRCLIDTFKQTDDEFLKQASAVKPAWKDGSTAVCVLAVDNTLYIANLGDSKASLCRYDEEKQKYNLIPLSKEHSPSLYEERRRIQKAGGTVKDGRIMGILEVSRSIGDGRFKHCGVSCIPDVKKCQLTPKDKYILLSCDGLWKGFTSETAMEFINQILEKEEATSPPNSPTWKTDTDVRYETACNKVAWEAIKRGSSDNVTVLLVRIDQR